MVAADGWGARAGVGGGSYRPPVTATPRPVGLLCAPSAFGGAQRYLLSMLVHLDAVLLPLEPVDAQLAAGAAGRPVVPLRELGQLAAVARAAGVGALHVNATDPVAEAPLLRAALGTGLPVTATVHMTDTYRRGPVPDDLPSLWAALGAVVAPSRPIAEHLVARQHVPAASVVHVPNGVAERPAPPPRAPGAGAPLLVGCLARLTRQKGLDVLLDALGRLERERPGAVAVLVAGEGREREALARASTGLPVTWAGHADDAGAVLGRVDAYVQPSREDALPLALLEAMMSGLPCAATDVGDVRELLGGALLLVPPEDPGALAAALARLADQPGLRAQLSALGRERALAGHTEALMTARTAQALAPVWGGAGQRTSAVV